MSAKCLEAARNAKLREGRGSVSTSTPSSNPPKSQKKHSWINASGGVTVSNKSKKGIIQ